MPQLLQTNPMKENRKSTNVAFIFVFSLLFIIWIALIITELCSGPNLEGKRRIYVADVFTIERLFYRPTWIFLLLTILSGIIVLIYTYIFSRSLGKFLIRTAVWLLFAWILFIITSTIVISVEGSMTNRMPLATLICILLAIVTYTVYLVIIYLSARDVGSKITFEIIQSSCRMIISHPTILLFCFAMSIVYFIIFLCGNYASTYITYNGNSNILYSVFTFYGYMAFLSFIFNFNDIVISGCIIDWFWKQDDYSSSLTIWRSIGRTLRFHMGTVAFASLPLLPQLCSIHHLSGHRVKNNDTKKDNILTRFFSQFNVFLFVSEFAVIQTAIYGYDCSTAILEVHNLIAQNNHRLYLAVSKISMVIYLVGWFFLTIPFVFVNPNQCFYSMALPFYMVFMTAVRALLINKMIIDHTSNSLQENCDNDKKAALPQFQASS